MRKIQHRYQKSVKGKTHKDGEDCHKNVNDENDIYVALFPLSQLGRKISYI